MKTTTTILFAIACFLSFGQGKFSDNLTIGGNYQFGYALPEYSILGHTITDYVQAFELNVYKEKYGLNKYEQIYGYPRIGLSLMFTTLGNKEVYGNAWALSYFYRINLLERKRFRVFNRLGVGLGYITKKHSLEDNYINVVIGSHWNIHFNARLGATFDLTDKLSVNGGVSFDHFSNGNISEPNIGLNGLTAYSGLNYLVGERKERIHNEIPAHNRTHSMEVFLNGGLKRTRSFLSSYYVAVSTSFEYNYQLSHIFILGGGADVFYDSSVRPQKEKVGESVKTLDSYQTGLHISQTLIYNKFWFTLQQGVYVGLQNKLNGKSIYNRGIVKYQFNDHFSARVAMKSHLHILDYPEVGFGYKF